jgi:antitoxin VapB
MGVWRAVSRSLVRSILNCVLSAGAFVCHVSLFRNSRNQAIRIPREFELEGTEAIIRNEGDRLIIEPVKQKSLKELLATLPTLDEDFPEITDPLVEPGNIF